MSKKTAINTLLLVLMVLGLGCAALWRNMSRKYIPKWNMPKRSASISQVTTQGNVCVVQHANGASEPLTCAEIQLFPSVYDAIGVDENKFKKWQDDYGFHSGGVSPSGAVIAPSYPIFSRLAWAAIDPVYLQGNDLSDLLEEANRISAISIDPAVQSNLEKLSALAEQAHERSQVLRFFG
jgi:hypothetical protein